MIRRVRPALVSCSLFLLFATALSALIWARHPSPPSIGHLSAATSIDTSLARDDAGCAGVRSTVWHPLSGLEYTGRLRARLPARLGGAVVFFVGDSIPLDLDAQTLDGRQVSLHLERLPPGPGVHVPPDFWLDDNTPWSAPPEIARATIDSLGHDVSFTLSLGRRAPRVLARLIGYPPETRVAVCADPVGEHEIYFATGWYGEETTAQGAIRWMREYGALLLASTTGRAAHIRLRAAPAVASTEDDDTILSLRVNDVFDAAPVAMRAGFSDYEWDIPDPAWVAGTNELFFTVSRTLARGSRTLGLALASVTAR